MDGILEPVLAILAIVLPIWLVYGLLELQEWMGRKKQAARVRRLNQDGKAVPGTTAQ